MANPDGNAVAQSGISAIHSDELRKIILDTHQSDMHLYDNIPTDINTYLKFWKANARGVDLNRNFNSNWAKIGGSTIPCFRSYKGPSAASEPETKIFEDLTKNLQGLVAVICIHSQGEVIYWDCGQPEEIRIPTLSLASLASDVTGYKIVYSQNIDASYSDWCVLEQNIPSITIEIGNGEGNSLLEFEQFDEIWQKNYLLWAALAENYS
jgi:g-D-glutamyl-meso-diaminopimelate peptidase